MELKSLTSNFIDLFGDLEKFNLEKITNENCEKYLKLIDNDLETDYLQKIWQFYMADREGKKQDFTPKSLAALVAQLTKNENEEWIYDMCCGSGALTIQKWRTNKSLKFVCEELDESLIPFLLFNLKLRNIEGYIINGNALTGEKKAIYKLTPGEQFSKIEVENEFKYPLFDTVISNPPFNLPGEYQTPAGATFTGANYKFIFSALEKIKKVNICFILPNSVLAGNGDIEARNYLINNKLLKASIVNPDSMFESTSISTCVLYIAESEKITFVDCRQKNHAEEAREQNGELHNKKRVYTKTFNVYSDENIASIIDAIKCQTQVPGFSITCEPQDSKLSPSAYVGFETEEKYTRSYYDIAKDLERVINQRNKNKLTINEVWAKEIHLTEVLEKMEQSNASLEELNNLFKNVLKLDVVLQKSSYLTISRNKELKLEQKTKDEITTNFVLAIGQWKALTHFLNLEENRLLTELKEKLLPDLMSGKIDVSVVKKEEEE